MSSESPDTNVDKENSASRSNPVKTSGNAKQGILGGLPKKGGKGSGAKSSLSFKDSNTLEKVKVGKEVNTKEDIVFEAKAKPFRLQLDGSELSTTAPFEWTPSMAGPLRLYRHKSDGKTRLVQRNPIGTVKLNLAIEGNVVELEQEIKIVKKRGRKPKKVAYVRFFAKADEETGIECFLLKVKIDKLDTLYDALEEMGAKVKEEN